MFSKISRYRKLPDITTVDVKGRILASKPSRLLARTEGKFLHTVEEMDRLDHLGFKYYKQPRKWWRICDANPDFMSPLALLGKDPIVTGHFPLTFDETVMQPPWALMIKGLSLITGIENFQVIEDIKIIPELRTINGEQITVNAEKFERGIIVTYNSMNNSIKEIIEVISTAGFEVGKPQNLGRIGKSIIIPPDIKG